MPERYVIFTGRPNAGKSSTIRALTGLKVAIGKRPGTTTRIKKYPIANGLSLVDMPGYGRKAGGSRDWEDRTKNLILDFIEENAEQILIAVHVLNITTFIETEERLAKKGFISLDVEMIGYLHETLGEFPLVAANKIDKGKEQDIVTNLEALMDRITDGAPEEAADYVYPLSAKKDIGVGALKNRFMKTLWSAGFSKPFKLVRS
ncbi:MAG: 50S ribosome-binding GTPase [Candidatus Bathyarchaeota archaeon]|nr:50S ribosome-binding GTPase [Candidatus Bathyarchaeota archaeon]